MSRCPDCDAQNLELFTRREFVQTVGVAAAAASTAAALPRLNAAEKREGHSETLVTHLFESLTPSQREEICFDYDYRDDRGLLRMYVANNWNITEPAVGSTFYTRDQQELIEAIFWGLYNPEWHDRVRKQLQDDAGGYGKRQSIAIFGEPGTGKFELVMTGRHLTIRCDGDSVEHTAFGGPIFYGHAAQGFNEKPDHPGNVYWHQALKANELYQMLDGRQRKLALIEQAPREQAVQFRASGELPGVPVSELSADQQQHVEEILALLLEPYRASDQSEVKRCLNAQGGLDKCRLALYKSGDIGNDEVWDVWRLEGPSFVWHFRGSPHVHVWVNVANDPSVKVYT